ncbi:hypothetical protein B0T10DRAFT_500499, partial [Thelonectria olida]
MSEPGPRRNMARNTTSCERCKQRKTKCDRQLPSCRRCEGAQVDCEYAGRRKPGFPAGHRQVLEDKIEKLEAELRALRANPGANTPDEPPTEAASGRETSSVTAVLPRDAASATYERTCKVKERQPPTDLLLSLTALYFRHIHPWFPFLDVRRVYADMGLMDEPSLLYYALFGVSLPYSFDSRLDQASSDSFWKYSKRRIFVDVLEEPSYSSLEVLTVLVVDLSGMTHGPQVWGALAVATKLAVQLNNTDGLIFRTSTADGGESLSKADRISRQRLFWAIYALDCYICITTNHPSTLSNDHIQHFLPSRQQAWRESPLEPNGSAATPAFIFSYQLELLDLSRKVHRVGVNYVTSVQNQESLAYWLEDLQKTFTELNDWMQALPSPLLRHDAASEHPPKAVGSALFMLHGYFHALVIYVGGLAAASAVGDLQLETHADIRQRCQEGCQRSVEAMAQIVAKATGHVSDKLGWPFAWSIWVAARYLIIQRYKAVQDKQQTSATLLLFSGFLVKMGRFWQISLTYARLLHQAISDLEAGIEGSVLQLMTDLRVPTSHLEDQSRPDPMLRGTINQDQPVSMYESPNPDFMALGRSDELLSVFPDELGFHMPHQTSDTWFRVPLFASSAYQYDASEPR